MAVGPIGPNVEKWDGSHWSATPVVDPGGGTSFVLSAVSCTSATACTAIGGYTSEGNGILVAERWNGSTWTLQSIPNPSGSTQATLSAVSCGSATACMAVGYYSTATLPYVLLTERWTGTSWKVVAAASPRELATLSAVSCSSASACIAVGQSGKYAERWSGSSWSAELLPQPTGGTDILNGVSCVSSTWCTAVGLANLGGAPVAVAWNGSQWKLQKTANPAQNPYPTPYPQGVSCTSPTSCTMVGYYDHCSAACQNGTTPNQQLTFAEHWDGTSWTLQTTKSPIGQTILDTLAAVSCVSSTRCTAVGTWTDIRVHYRTLVETSQGSTWATQTSADPLVSINDVLASVSCPSATACTAVGGVDINDTTLAEVWNGSKWAVQPIPTPTPRPGSGDSAHGFLKGVSCPSTSMCMAVGQQNVTRYGQPTAPSDLSELWSGGKWTILPAPSGGRTDSELLSVSCPTATFCVAAGTTEGLEPVLETWRGSSWTIDAVPIPSPYGAGLFGVSCTSASNCTAVGFYTPSQEVPLAIRWNGSVWTRQGAPAPRGSSGSIFYGVSCSTAMACTAVGSSGQPLAEYWNGAKWSINSIPIGSDGYARFADTVSCRSSAFCEAGGYYPVNYSVDVAGALGWNGSKWAVQSVPTPASDPYSWLYGVSCASTTVCFAVGGGATGGTPSTGTTLVERYSG